MTFLRLSDPRRRPPGDRVVDSASNWERSEESWHVFGLCWTRQNPDEGAKQLVYNPRRFGVELKIRSVIRWAILDG